MNHVITYAGRDESHPSEKKDCTVRAHATAAGIPYAVAHRVLASYGRKPGKGVVFASIASRLGYTERVQPTRGRMRVKTAVQKYSKGRFVFRMRGHVLAVVDGVSYDRLDFSRVQNCIVTNVWEWPYHLAPPGSCP